MGTQRALSKLILQIVIRRMRAFEQRLSNEEGLITIGYVEGPGSKVGH